MATAEPTRTENADPGPGSGPRIGMPETREADARDADGTTGRERETRLRTAVLTLRERMLRHPVLSVTGLAGVLHVVWFFTFANSGGDLAAQDAWAEFVGRHPDSAYNLAWYGGMHPVSYSVVSPYLMSVLGVRTTMMIAGTVAAGLLTLLLLRSRSVRNPCGRRWRACSGCSATRCPGG